jgi:putative oxidoreductase
MTTRDSRADQAFAILRVVAGIVFAAHGWQKFFVMGIAGTTGFFTSVGAPLPALAAPVVATLELAGGAAVVLGLFTRPIALLLACDMATAIILVHAKNGFFVPGGIEFVMTLGTAALALALGGAGAWSADRALALRKSG